MKRRLAFLILCTALCTTSWAVVSHIYAPESYAGDDGTVDFVFHFDLNLSSELVVTLVSATGVESLQVENSDYTVAGTNSNYRAVPGGTVTFAVAPTTGYTVVLSRQIEPTQDRNASTLARPTSIQDAVDKLTLGLQDALDQIKRALRTPIGGYAQDMNLPGGWQNTAGYNYWTGSQWSLATVVTAGTLTVLSPWQNILSGATTTTVYGLLNLSDATVVAEKVRKNFGTINVKDYGAKGDGLTNDTVAIQAAFTYAATHNCDIYFPTGTYKITSQINWTPVADVGSPANYYQFRRITITGNGASSAILQTVADANGIVLQGGLSGFNYASLRDFQIGCRSGTGSALVCKAMARSEIRNVTISGGGKYGLWMYGSLMTSLHNVVGSTSSDPVTSGLSFAAPTGAWIRLERNAATNNPTNMTLDHCVTEQNTTGHGIWISDAATLSMQNCVAEAVTGSGKYALFVDGCATIFSDAFYIGDQASDHGFKLKDVTGGTFGVFTVGPSGELAKCMGMTLSGCSGSINGIQIDPNCEGVVVRDMAAEPIDCIRNQSADTEILNITPSAGLTTYPYCPGIRTRNFPLVQGGVGSWSGNTPLELTAFGTATVTAETGTVWAKEAKSAKVVVADGSVSGLLYVLPTNLRGQWVSMEAMVYVSATPPSGGCEMGLSTVGSVVSSCTHTGSWVKLQASWLVPNGNGSYAPQIMSKGTATFYVGYVNIWCAADVRVKALGTPVASSYASHDYGNGSTAWTMTAEEATATLFLVSNANGGANAVFPAAVPGKQFTVVNSSGQTITFRVGSHGGVAVSTSGKKSLFMGVTDVNAPN